MGERTAAERTTAPTRVRAGRGRVHELATAHFDRARGHYYVAGCGRTLTREGGAVLTTFPADCPHCAAVRP